MMGCRMMIHNIKNGKSLCVVAGDVNVNVGVCSDCTTYMPSVSALLHLLVQCIQTLNLDRL